MQQQHYRRAQEHREELTRRYREGETVASLERAFSISRFALYRCLFEWDVDQRGRAPFPQTITVPKSPALRGYIAGILDGEGTITILRPNKNTQHRLNAKIQIASTTRELHDWLLNTVGGKVYERKLEHLGKKRIWYWHLARIRDVEALLRAILPYLIIKRALAEEALMVLKAQL